MAQEQLEAARALAKDLEDKIVEVKIKAGGGRPDVRFRVHERDRVSRKRAAEPGY